MEIIIHFVYSRMEECYHGGALSTKRLDNSPALLGWYKAYRTNRSSGWGVEIFIQLFSLNRGKYILGGEGALISIRDSWDMVTVRTCTNHN